MAVTIVSVHDATPSDISSLYEEIRKSQKNPKYKVVTGSSISIRYLDIPNEVPTIITAWNISVEDLADLQKQVNDPTVDLIVTPYDIEVNCLP
jgi:hypothetical protein